MSHLRLHTHELGPFDAPHSSSNAVSSRAHQMATATTNNHNQLQRRLTKTTQPARPHAISPASGKLDVAQKNECMQLARMMNHDQLPVMCQEYVSSMTQTKRSFDGASHKEVFCFCALLRPPFSDSFSHSFAVFLSSGRAQVMHRNHAQLQRRMTQR